MLSYLFLFMMYFLSALFGLGVYAQYVQIALAVEPIPGFEIGQIEILSRPITLGLQICVMGFLIHTVRSVRKGTMRPKRWKYRACFILGGPYFSLMLLRWSAELSILAESGSISKVLQLFLHVVLAAFMLLLGLHTYLAFRNRRLFRPARHF